MFYVGAIDEKLNDKGYIVPGYINRRVNFNDSRTELEILVTGCSALESRRDKLAEVDRTTSQMIELMSTANLSEIPLFTSPVSVRGYLSTSPNTRSIVPIIATTSGK